MSIYFLGEQLGILDPLGWADEVGSLAVDRWVAYFIAKRAEEDVGSGQMQDPAEIGKQLTSKLG